MSETLATTLVDRLEDVRCDREPFTDSHKHCICRLTNEAAREITSLRSQLEAAKVDHRTAVDHLLARTHLVNRKTEEIERLRVKLEEARAKAIEECALIAAAFENPHIPLADRPYVKGVIEGQNTTVTVIVRAIRALLSAPTDERGRE